MLDTGVFYGFLFLIDLNVGLLSVNLRCIWLSGIFDDQHTSALQCAALQFERNSGEDIFRLSN